MRIVVVGGGIVGASTAWACVRRGHEVVLLEQGPLPNPLASSFGAHRLIRAPYGDFDGYARLIPAAHAAWDRLWADLGRSLYAATGTLALGREGGSGWTASSAAQMDRLGIRHERLGVADIDARWPWIRTLPGDWGFFLPTGGVLFARRILEALAGWLQPRATLRAGARVVDVDGARVRLAGGEWIGGDAVVIAAGPWVSGILPEFAARVTPSRQVVAYLRPPPGLAAAWSGAPMLLDVGTAGFYAVPPAQGSPLKVGDHRFSLSGDPDRDREAGAAELRAVADLARDRLRGFDDYAIVGGRTCFYTVRPDERFVVERRGDAVVATGFSGHGFKFGALVGATIADHLAGDLDAAALTAWAAGR